MLFRKSRWVPITAHGQKCPTLIFGSKVEWSSCWRYSLVCRTAKSEQLKFAVACRLARKSSGAKTLAALPMRPQGADNAAYDQPGGRRGREQRSSEKCVTRDRSPV